MRHGSTTIDGLMTGRRVLRAGLGLAHEPAAAVRDAELRVHVRLADAAALVLFALLLALPLLAVAASLT